jgi:hypothetical protein
VEALLVRSVINCLPVTSDDSTLVANAGLLLPMTLAVRLGVGGVVNAFIQISRGGAMPGRKVLTLVATMLVGGSHIDHADMLRAGAT